MKLNRTGSNWTELERNKINENWDIIEGGYNDVVGKISDEVVGHLIDSAKLIWKEPVDTVGDLPTNAEVGETRMVREADPEGISYVYRFNGEKWEKIQEIDVTLVNEVDRRLSAQLAETEKESFKSSLINHKSRKRMVLWTDDDGMAGIYTIIAPLLKEYGIKATFAILTGKGHGFPIDGLPAHNPAYASYEQLKEMYDEGIAEFVPHSHTHAYFDSISDDQIHYELETSQKIIRKLGWNYKDFIYPGGRHDDNIMSITSQYYESALKVGMGGATIPFDQYAIPRISLSSNGFDPQAINSQIDDALDELGFAILMTHVDLGIGLNESNMRQVIEHVLNNTEAEFVTLRELIREHGNIMQQRDNIITASGEIYGKDIGVYRRADDRAPNDPITEFPKGVTTRTKILQNDSHLYNIPPGWNKKPYGIMETFRDPRQEDYSFQRFQDIPNTRILFRSWNRSEGFWNDWDVVGGLHDYLKSIPKNAPITSFPKGKVIKLRIHIDEYADYLIPDFGNSSVFGFIETHRDHNQDQFSSQTFTDIYNSIQLIRRWSTSTNNWTSWLPLSYYYNLPNPPPPNAPITTFRKGLITNFRLQQGLESDYNIPSDTNSTFGYIETFRDRTQEAYSFQKLYDIRNNRILFRRWLTNDGKWGDWEKV